MSSSLAVLLAAAGATARNFYKVDPRAGRLLFPYIAWLVLANALNLNLASRNYSVSLSKALFRVHRSASTSK